MCDYYNEDGTCFMASTVTGRKVKGVHDGNVDTCNWSDSDDSD